MSRSSDNHPYRRYIDEFVKLKCAPDILAQGLFPNGKEITESMGAWHGAMAALGGHASCGRRDVTLVDVGCGSTPRTAALFAYRTRWDCWAVDPRTRRQLWDVNGLVTVKDRIENLEIPCSHTAVLVAVHSHADLEASVRALRGWRELIVVAMPCCKPLELEFAHAGVQYEDLSIWSPHRTIRIYSRFQEGPSKGPYR